MPAQLSLKLISPEILKLHMPFFSKISDGVIFPCNKKIIVFGNGGHAKTIHGYFFSENVVEGFVVDDQYVLNQPMIGKIPVIPLSEITHFFPPEKYAVLVALAFRDLNEFRMIKTNHLVQLGYDLVSFMDKSVRFPSRFDVGSNSIILGNVDIHEDVVIGNGVFVSSGAVIGHDSTLNDYSWVGSGAVLAGAVNLGKFSVLGMNATVKQNTSLADYTLVSPNTFVNADTNLYASVIGESGKVVSIDSRKLLRMAYK